MAQNLPPPPPVADGTANHLLNGAYAHQQGPVVTAATQVAQASSRKKNAEELYLRAPPLVTQDEFGEQELHYFRAANHLAVPVGLAQAIAPINAQLNALGAQLNALGAQLNTLPTKANLAQAFHNLNARQINSTLVSVEEQLEQIQNPAGVVAPNYPTTLQAFYTLNNQQRRQLLLFYGRPANPMNTREQRLRKLFGIRL